MCYLCCWLCVDGFCSFIKIADLANEDTPQLYTVCGRGPRSTLRVLRHGLEVRSCFDTLNFTMDRFIKIC